MQPRCQACLGRSHPACRRGSTAAAGLQLRELEVDLLCPVVTQPPQTQASGTSISPQQGQQMRVAAGGQAPSVVRPCSTPTHRSILTHTGISPL